MSLLVRIASRQVIGHYVQNMSGGITPGGIVGNSNPNPGGSGVMISSMNPDAVGTIDAKLSPYGKFLFVEGQATSHISITYEPSPPADPIYGPTGAIKCAYDGLVPTGSSPTNWASGSAAQAQITADFRNLITAVLGPGDWGNPTLAGLHLWIREYFYISAADQLQLNQPSGTGTNGPPTENDAQCKHYVIRDGGGSGYTKGPSEGWSTMGGGIPFGTSAASPGLSAHMTNTWFTSGQHAVNNDGSWNQNFRYFGGTWLDYMIHFWEDATTFFEELWLNQQLAATQSKPKAQVNSPALVGPRYGYTGGLRFLAVPAGFPYAKLFKKIQIATRRILPSDA